MKKKFCSCVKKLYSNRLFNIYFIILCFSMLFLIKPFVFHYILGDDTKFHLANIISRSHNVFGVILPLIGNNLGYGIGIFYPPLPHVLGSVFLLLVSKFGFSSVASIKVLKALVIILSGFLMYRLGSNLYKDKRKGMFCALFYISSSYFFVDLFMRDALNESFVFMFVPLVFLGFYYLFIEKQYKKFYFCFILGYVGLIMSHLVLATWFTIILLSFLMFYKNDIMKRNVFCPLFISAIIILLLTSTFTVPLIEHKIFGNYSIFASKVNNIPWTLPLSDFLNYSAYLTGESNILFVNFSPIVIILLILSLIKLFKDKNNKNSSSKFLKAIFIFTILSTILISFSYIWIIIPNMLKNIQFAWRLTIFTTFGVCLLAGGGLSYALNIFRPKYVYIGSLLIIVFVFLFMNSHISLVHFFDNVSPDVSNHGMGWQQEYLPTKTKKNIGYFNYRDSNKILILSGSAQASILVNNVPDMTFSIKKVKQKTTIELPRLYYLGYQIIDNHGKIVLYKEDKYGFIKINVFNNGIYHVKYVGTKGYKIALFLRTVTIAFIIVIVIKWIGESKNEKNIINSSLL